MEIAEEKVLVFDADVLIHFMQAGCFSDLKRIYPNNKKVVLQKRGQLLVKRLQKRLGVRFAIKEPPVARLAHGIQKLGKRHGPQVQKIHLPHWE